MSQTQTAERVPPAEDPFRMSFADQPAAERQSVVPTGIAGGAAVDQAMARIVTAQRVAIKRNLAGVLKEAIALAKVMGPKIYYSWQVENRRAGTKSVVEGPTIKAAMAAVSIYGNCIVEAFPAQESATHWVFAARFIDYETGVNIVRTFQQRKSQSVGRHDADRQLDIVYQIGQSKAMRNVISAGLPWMLDEMVEAAKEGFIEKVKANIPGYKARIKERLDEHEIALERVERQLARTFEHWRAQDVAKVITLLQAIQDGTEDAEDVWPREAPKGGEELEGGHGGQTASTSGDPPPNTGDGAGTTTKRTRGPNKPKTPPAGQDTQAGEDGLTNRIDGGRTDLDPRKTEPGREEPPHDTDGVIQDQTPPNTGQDTQAGQQQQKPATGKLDFD